MEPIGVVPDEKNREVFDLVKSAVYKQESSRPFLMGITGAGGAGKTTFAHNLVRFYGAGNCVSIDLDDYLISREERGKMEISGYHPQANLLSLARQHIDDLRAKRRADVVVLVSPDYVMHLVHMKLRGT
jgi:uridine kinase